MGPKEVAKAFKLKETIMSRRGIGFAAAHGSGIEDYGEKKIVGYTEDGGGISLRIRRVEVKKVLDSVHKLNMRGNVVVLVGERATRGTRRRTRRQGLITSRASTSRASGCP